MKQCGSDQHSSLLASATEDELSVSQILLEIENLIMVLRTKSIWGRKKRRSSLPVASSYSPEQPTSRPASVHSNRKEEKVRTPQVKAEEEECPATKTSSPTTPLSFLPSESDEKSKHSSKKRVLKTCPKKEETQLETIGFRNLVVDPTQHYRMTMLNHHQTFIADPTAQKFQHSFGPITAPQIGSVFNGLEPVNHVGPAKIPDLNVSAEETFGVDTSQPLDVDIELADKRARFAEARRTRRRIIRVKSMRSACGIKLPRIGF